MYIYVCMYVCMSIYLSICTYVYLQVHLKKIEYHEKGQYFLALILQSETHIVYRFIMHRVKYFKPLFLEFFYLFSNLADAFIQRNLQMRRL